MQAVAVGATLARRRIVWTVIKQKHWDTSVELTLRSGRRTVVVSVGICLSGPVLWEVGLQPIEGAPTQRELLTGVRGA